MRRTLFFLAALAVAGAAAAEQRPGPTALPAGVARGGLAARAGQIHLNRRVAGELKDDAPVRSRAPVLKGGNMRAPSPTRPTAAPKRKPAPKLP